jgi:hypothetical protein
MDFWIWSAGCVADFQTRRGGFSYTSGGGEGQGALSFGAVRGDANDGNLLEALTHGF